MCTIGIRWLAAKLSIFTDIFSIAHTLFGALSAILGFQLEATIVYLFYQFMDFEPPEEKLGDIVEFALGLVIGKLVALVL